MRRAYFADSMASPYECVGNRIAGDSRKVLWVGGNSSDAEGSGANINCQ